LLKAETVAFGGSLAKLSRSSFPGVHCSSRNDVSTCAAARSGRSANTIEFGDTPVKVSLLPWRLAPLAFKTISEGTNSSLAAAEGSCNTGRQGPIVMSDPKI
jgi:hypothetical protein